MVADFIVSSNRYSKTNRAETFTFDNLECNLGVCVSWHEDKDDDEGEQVPCIEDKHTPPGFGRYNYHVPVGALIRVVLCVAPMSAWQQKRAVATAMLLHQRLGSILSHLDDITKDALLCTIVGRSCTITLSVDNPGYWKKDYKDYNHKKLAVELNPAEPYELPCPLRFDEVPDRALCIVRNDKNNTFLELEFKSY